MYDYSCGAIFYCITEKAKADKTAAAALKKTVKSDLVKFGLKAKEQTNTNVKEANVLDQSKLTFCIL